MPRRKTADLIALIFAVTVAVVVVASAVALLWIELMNPRGDVSDGADAIGKLVSVMVGALVGFMAGRATNNGNGAK